MALSARTEGCAVGTALLVLAAVLFIAAAPQFGPRQLGPGAIVSHGGVDYVVRGSVTYREGPFVWWEHLLEGGDQPLWFSVEDDDGRLELAMWAKRADL